MWVLISVIKWLVLKHSRKWFTSSIVIQNWARFARQIQTVLVVKILFQENHQFWMDTIVALLRGVAWLTFFNASRTQKILPKHFKATGCCICCKKYGSILLTSSGNRYHLNWSIESLQSLKAPLNLSPSSQATDAKPKAQHASTIITNILTEFSSLCNWNWEN